MHILCLGDDTAVDQCTSDLEGCKLNSDPNADRKYSAEANSLQGINFLF